MSRVVHKLSYTNCNFTACGIYVSGLACAQEWKNTSCRPCKKAKPGPKKRR